MRPYSTIINAQDLEMLRAGNADSALVILDCRFSLADTKAGERAYAEDHIPGARYVDLDRDLSSQVVAGKTGRHPLPDKAKLVQRFQDWGISSTTQVVSYDDKMGPMAARLWWLCRWLGHAQCAVLNGGYAYWKKLNLPTSSEVPDPCRGTLQIGAPLLEAIDIDTAASGTMTLIDAREAPRYRGEHEPIDAVAGHIPGAQNYPFLDNLDEHGLWLSPAELAKRFASLQQSTHNSAAPLAHYCGSGITAAHNILAMSHAGLTPGALYAGSFSEWITRDDEQFPVARQAD